MSQVPAAGGLVTTIDSIEAALIRALGEPENGSGPLRRWAARMHETQTIIRRLTNRNARRQAVATSLTALTVASTPS